MTRRSGPPRFPLDLGQVARPPDRAAGTVEADRRTAVSAPTVVPRPLACAAAAAVNGSSAVAAGYGTAAAPAARGREPLRPQRLLHAAALDAARQVTPSGLGLDSAGVRERMVERLRAEGLRCEPVFDAMRLVPRHLFVDTALAGQAYEDTSLPIGHGQTISKPSVVARMIELLHLGASARARAQTGPGPALGRVLEVGTGCGYQTALLARLGQRVLSIERIGPLFDKARTHLAPWRLDSVRLVHGDGMLGHAPHAPFDSIIAAAGGEAVPQAWLDQLAIGGRLVAPMQGPGGGQVLVVIDREATGYRQSRHEGVHFVPLKSGVL